MIKLLLLVIPIAMILGLFRQQNINIDPILTSMRNQYASYQKQQQQKADQDRFNNLSDWDKFKVTALRVAHEEDYPASVLIGQAALESGHGTSKFCRERYNCFGMNANDKNPNDAFTYTSVEEGIRDYITRIKSGYKIAYSHREDPIKMLSYIAPAYASDPTYITKVINQPEFQEYLNK